MPDPLDWFEPAGNRLIPYMLWIACYKEQPMTKKVRAKIFIKPEDGDTYCTFQTADYTVGEREGFAALCDDWLTERKTEHNGERLTHVVLEELGPDGWHGTWLSEEYLLDKNAPGHMGAWLSDVLMRREEALGKEDS
jgi:hypothetical protein